MVKYIRTVCCIPILLLGISLQAQDIHFSQFYMAPLHLNPALTGVMNCNSRFIANYRNQWASILGADAYNTFAASYDHKIPVGRNDYFGIGGSLWGDVAGASDFQTLQGRLSGSYSRRMGGYREKSHYLVAGADVGLAQRSINFLKLRFGTQHDGAGGFDPNAPSGENIPNDNITYFDVAAGLLWFSVLGANTNFYIGAAAHHLNQPNISFRDGASVPINARYVFHAGGEYQMSDNMSVVPGAVFLKQGPQYEINAGTSLRFLLSQDKYYSNSFQFGAWIRLVNYITDISEPQGPSTSSIAADAIIVSTKFDYENFGIGFSYDWNVSDLKVASNGNGAFEFSLIYTICGAENRGVYCPSF